MHPDRTPSEFVVHVARLFHRGVICPSETWRQIHDAIESSSVITIFNGLDDTGRELVLGIHRKRPMSLKSLSEASSESHFTAMLDWCNANVDG